MKFLIDFIKGGIIGIANIVPGVSGGTLALMLGVYNKMLGAISGLLKQFKKSVKILHCDRCGREVEFDADSNMTEDWIIVCKECRKDMD